ncbi:MAG: hypothetical protein JNK15_07470 [Planctomycetes bacterium]|nr:hypothetical protein [Planctomycetota bacterium]
MKAWLRARIAEQTGLGAAADWSRDVMREHQVLLVDGNAAFLWFLGLDGSLWSVDSDSVAHRLEPERDAAVVREVLVRAAQAQPELAELLEPPVVGELTSPDGRLCVRTAADSRIAGYDHEDVTRLIVTEVATGAVLVDMHLRTPGLQPVQFVAPRRLLLANADGERCERDLPDPEHASDPAPPAAREPIRFDYTTGRAGVVGMVSLGFAGALAATCAVGSAVSGVGSAPLLLAFAVAFSAGAVVAKTYSAQQVVDFAAGELRELRRSALHHKPRTWPLAAFDRVQHWRGLNRGAPTFYLTLEGRDRCLLLPASRDPRAMLPIGERLAGALGVAWNAEPIPDRLQPPR